MDYESWILVKLRDECRKRNARISGKKAHLVESLEAYDRYKKRQNRTALMCLLK